MSLSYSEVRAILTQTGEPLQTKEVVEFFQIVDEDQDGMLHIDELMKARRLSCVPSSRSCVRVPPRHAPMCCIAIVRSTRGSTRLQWMPRGDGLCHACRWYMQTRSPATIR